MKTRIAGALLSFALLSAEAIAADIHVPADQPTIQRGIDAAVDGDRVLVAEGKYPESIDFKGKAIELLSTGNPHRTIIRGTGRTVVLIGANPSSTPVLSGFRIEGGSGSVGGGILVTGSAAPEIRSNIIQNNSAFGGGGIAVQDKAAPWIHDNVIEHNEGGGTNPGGGGILVASSKFVVIENNRIHANSASNGAGIAIRGAGTTIVVRNHIRRNRATVGGGVYAETEKVRIVGNLIAYNGANTGAGIRTVTHGQHAHAIIANNTVAYNDHGRGSGISSDTEDKGSVKIYNNIIVQRLGSGHGVFCNQGHGTILFGNNLIRSPRGSPSNGKCTWEGTLLRVDPQFVGGGREADAFRLLATSPAIDAGDSNAGRKYNDRDLGGEPRILGDAVDLGAFEFSNLTSRSGAPD